MTRAIIYARVSSEEQAGEGKTSIETQLTDCRQLAAKLGWMIVGEHVEDKRYRVGKRMFEPSGTRADRPQWKRMLETLAAGKADAVLAWHSTRLFRAYRPLVDFLDVLDAHPAIQVQLVKEQFSKDTAILYAWVGRKENEARVERFKFGLAGRAKKGLPPAGKSRWYKKILEPATGEILGYEFDDRYRPTLDELARLFIGGFTYHEIARRLGRHPITGKRWGRVSVQKTLLNPLYKGRVEFLKSRGQPAFVVPALQKPIWDAATCAAIDAELERRARLGSPHSLAPFSGILHCGYCGRLMTSHRQSRRSDRPNALPYRTYTCQRRYRIAIGDIVDEEPHAPNCISERKLLRLLREQVQAVNSLDLDDAITLIASLVPASHSHDSRDQAELAALEAQITEMEPDLALVRSTGARAALDADLSDLKHQAELLRQRLATSQPRSPVDWDQLRSAWGEVRNDLDPFNLPDDQLRARLVALFPALYYRGGEIGAAPF